MKILISTVSAVFLFVAGPAVAEQNSWRIEKLSGDVALVTKAATASASKDAVLAPGDAIRTGRNGRVLLMRGKESILVSPGSSITIPDAASEGLATTIAQQSGTILLDVEKRNVQHFEVETPYLAAVVKGTRFEVTVGSNGAQVRVREGAVEVADLKSGQFAIVSPGQTARVGQNLRAGLTLSGAGHRNPIQQGTPRIPRVQPINTRSASAASKASSIARAAIVSSSSHSIKITKAVGAVKLDVDGATRGLIRSADNLGQTRNQPNDSRPSRWNAGVDAQASLPPGRSTAIASGNSGRGNGSGAGTSSGNGNGNGNAYGLLGGNGVGQAIGLLRGIGSELGNRGRGRGRGRS